MQCTFSDIPIIGCMHVYFILGNGIINAPWLDFTIITLCDHHIIGMGTFSLTSAFLGNGTIVYDSNKYSNLRGLKLDPSTYIPLNFTTMSTNFTN